MEVMDVIRTRRSIRRFAAKPIPRETIVELLEAANLAPTASNRQPWEFVVVGRSYLDCLYNTLNESFSARVTNVSERTMRETIKDLPIPVDVDEDKLDGIRRFYKTLGGSPVAIVVTLPKEGDYWTYRNNISDAAAAIENLILAGWDQGLGTCWMTGPLTTRAKEIAHILEIPEDREIVALVAVGYPDQQPRMPPKKNVAMKTRWLGFEWEE
jgi:nitroreductase